MGNTEDPTTEPESAVPEEVTTERTTPEPSPGERSTSERTGSRKADEGSGPINQLHGNVGGAREVEIREREADMVKMRVAGVSVRTIAARYDVDPSRVSHIIGRALKHSVSRPSGELRGEMVAQIDRLIEAHASTALGMKRTEGDEVPTLNEQQRATDVITRLLERRARLTGLDSIQLNVSDVSQEERASALADQLRAFLQGRVDAQAEATGEAQPVGAMSVSGGDPSGGPGGVAGAPGEGHGAGWGNGAPGGG